MKEIKIILFVLIFLIGMLCLVWALPQKVFLIGLSYDNGTASLTRFLVTDGYYNAAKENSGDYEIKGLSCDDKILFSQKFNFNLEVYMAPPPEWFDENGNQIYIPNETESVVKLDKAEKDFIFPYSENTKEIVVYNNGSEIVKIDKGFETTCAAQQDKAQDEKPGTNEKENKASEIIPIILVILFIAVIIFYLIYRRTKRGKKEKK